jgi:hypothetical protein
VRNIRLSRAEKERISSSAGFAWLRDDRSVRKHHASAKHAGFDGNKAEDYIWRAFNQTIPTSRRDGYISTKTIAGLVEAAKREINSYIGSMKWLAKREGREYVGPETHLLSVWGGWTPPEEA